MSRPRASVEPASERPRDFAAIARRYERDALSGRIPVCKWIRLAIERDRRDLAENRGRRALYRFDEEAGARVCRFVEKLPHTKGQWARDHQRLILSPWQVWVVMRAFGWKRRADGLRRFREVFLFVSRKNGKSALAAALAAYMLLADNEFGAEVYIGASTERQAFEVFRPLTQMLRATPRLVKAAGIELWAKSVSVPSTNSRCEPLIGRPHDGSSPSFAVADEFHQHASLDLISTMQTGMGAREQPMLLITTTAGSASDGGLSSPCYHHLQEVQRVLDGIERNDELFAALYTLDDGDDWRTGGFETFVKANPGLDVSLKWKDLQAMRDIALTASPMAQGDFKTKRCNLYVSNRSSLFAEGEWAACGDPELREADVQAMPDIRKTVFAVDLASVSDLACTMRMYSRFGEDGKEHYYLFGSAYLNEQAAQRGPNRLAYGVWERSGHLIVTDGSTTDHNVLVDELLDDAARVPTPHQFEVVFDPFTAPPSVRRVQEAGYIAIEFVQRDSNYAVPLDRFVAAVKERRLHHDGNPALAFCVANTGLKRTRKGLYCPDKTKPDAKIDMTVASLMAMSRIDVVDDGTTLPAGYEILVM